MRKANKNKTRNQRFLACPPRRGQSNKRGELTTQQIVMLIILIISFVVILFLLFRLNLGRTTDAEICHNSVVLKSKTEGLVGELDCKTNYVCIGDKCEGINPTETIKINMKKEDETVKQEIMKTIAEEMSDCWWMFGEGEVKYGAWLNYHCAICSIVKFDKKIQTKFNEITYKEFYDYLKDTKKDETQTYLIYLYNVFEVDSVKEMNEKIDFDNEVIFTNEKYAIVTGMKGVRKGEYLYPYFVKSNEVEDKTECSIFDITKA